MKAGLDANGKVVAMHSKIACPSILALLRPEGIQKGIDFTATRTFSDSPYTIANDQCDYAMRNPHVPVGFWRAPGLQNSYYRECFIDELAHAAGKDPLQFQLDLLGPAKKPTINKTPFGEQVGFDNARLAVVLKAVAEKSGWGKKKLPKGTGLGLAAYFSHSGYFAEVVQASVNPKSGEVRVEKVWVAGDVGRQIVNPSPGMNQVEGSAIDGVSQALGQALTFTNGRVDQSNFHDYPLLRMHQAPQVEVHFVMTDNNPTGLGEPALPPVVPALTNAIFAATGKRVRTLPIKTSELKGFA